MSQNNTSNNNTAVAVALAAALAARAFADKLIAAAEDAQRDDDRGFAYHMTHCGPEGGASFIVKAAQAAAAKAAAAADRAQEAYEDLKAQAS